MTAKSPIVIAGLQCSGVSSIAAMVEAGGFPDLGELPVNRAHTPGSISKWLDGLSRNAVFRLIDPHRIGLATGIPYRIIIVTRAPKDIARSQLRRLVQTGGKGPTVSSLQAMAERNQATTINVLRAQGGGSECIQASFDHAINNPGHQAAVIARFLDLPADRIDAMAGAIRDRLTTPKGRRWPPVVREAQG